MTKDNIIIRKIWQDSELAQLEVTCTSSVATAITKIYVSDELIDELICKISAFLDGCCEESEWANESRGNFSTACVCFHLIKKDKLGHILIEVFAELEDGGDYAKHNSCFFVNTEYGCLRRFCSALPFLKSDYSECEIHLN